jgi:hypothetical protein
MFLDTVNNKHPERTTTAGEPAFMRWQDLPHSRISHHGSACCEGAKEWFIAMDYSQLNGSSPLTGPRWIRKTYEWGPSKHPIYWCEAVKRKTLDCGALAALAHEAFRARGVKSFPAQLVQQYSADATVHWMHKWEADDTSLHWIKNDVIYHEGCALLMPDATIKLWDASAAWWIDPQQKEGYGSLIALRIHAANAPQGTAFRWGKHTLAANGWITLKDKKLSPAPIYNA